MKKLKCFVLVLTMLTSLVFVTTNTNYANTESKNYLAVGKNLYKDENIQKGILSNTLKDILANDTGVLNRLKATYGDDVENKTLLDFYTENGYAPEDRYATWPVKITDQNGRFANTSVKQKDELTTFEFPYEMIKPANEDHVKYPNLFARLTVGERPDIWTTNNYQWKSWIFTQSVNDLEVMKNLIGYGWESTADDFILNKDGGYDNKIAIPTRFNTERDDVFLTMRGASPDRYNSFLTGARAHLQAISVDGVAINNDVSDRASNKYYINTTTKIGITDAGFQILGNDGKSMVGKTKVFDKANEKLVNRPISEFDNDVNGNLDTIEAIKNRINLGVGGQIQLTGLYRNSSLDAGSFTVDEEARIKDSAHTTNVEYYMYRKATNELYSPNKSKFDIDTTRPYFADFGDLTTPIAYDEDNFDNTLGADSYIVKDNGILKDGIAVKVDYSRVRVRIKDNETLSTNSFTLEELKNELKKSENAGKRLKLIYTYAAPDADDTIVGLIPSEIDAKAGAYAVPIERTVVLPEDPQGTLEIEKVDSKDNNKKLANVEFKIYKDEEEVKTIVTDEEGTATVKLPLGTYTLKETKTNEDYVLDETPHEINLEQANQTVALKIKNMMKEVVPPEPEKGTLEIEKVDSQNHATKLANVEFKVYKDGTEVAELVTNPDGIAKVELPLGTYTVKEIKTNEGYVLDETVKTVNLENNGAKVQLLFENTKEEVVPPVEIEKKGTLKIEKVDGKDSNKKLVNVEFKVYKDDIEVAELVTNPDGIAKVELPLGTYTVKEIKTNEGYVLDKTVHNVVLANDKEVMTLVVKNMMKEVEPKPPVDPVEPNPPIEPEPVPPVEPTTPDEPKPQPPTKKTVETGDDNNLYGLIFVFSMSAIVLFRNRKSLKK